MNKLKKKLMSLLLSFYQDSIVEYLSKKYEKKIENNEFKILQQLVLRAANNIKYEYVEKFQIKTWSANLYLNLIPNFDPSTNFAQIFGENDWIKNLVIKIFNISNYEKMVKGENDYFLIFFREPGENWINLIAAQNFFKNVIEEKIKFSNQKEVLNFAQKIKLELNDRITFYGKDFLINYLKYKKPKTKLCKLVGSLIFCTSFKQNVFNHSYEMAEMANQIALQLQLNPLNAKRAAFFHDIGKVLEGHENHVNQGVKIAEEFRLDKIIVNTIKCSHYNESYKNVCDSEYSIISRLLDKVSCYNGRFQDEKYIKEIEALIVEKCNHVFWVKSVYVKILKNLLIVYIKPKEYSLHLHQQYYDQIIKILDCVKNEKKFGRSLDLKFMKDKQNLFNQKYKI